MSTYRSILIGNIRFIFSLISSLFRLSINSIYQPYVPKLRNVDDVRSIGKRQSEVTDSEAGPSKLKQRPTENLPKWFRKP